MKYLLFLILFISFSGCTEIKRIDDLKQTSLEEIRKIEKEYDDI